MTRLTLSRDDYIPIGATPGLVLERLGVEVFFNDTAAKAFSGTKVKPDFNRRFRNIADRDAAVKTWFDAVVKKDADKTAARAAKSAWNHDIKIGDVFVSSWGYDQTNVDYYEITAVHGKAVEIKKLDTISIALGYGHGESHPIPGQYAWTEARRVIPQPNHTGGARIKINSSATAYPLQPIANTNGVKTYPKSRWTNDR